MRFKRTNKKIKKIKTLKKSDLIRIKNSSQRLEDIKDRIYEFILLKNLQRFFKK